jgi:hypothetical protein
MDAIMMMVKSLKNIEKSVQQQQKRTIILDTNIKDIQNVVRQRNVNQYNDQN